MIYKKRRRLVAGIGDINFNTFFLYSPSLGNSNYTALFFGLGHTVSFLHGVTDFIDFSEFCFIRFGGFLFTFTDHITYIQVFSF